jgi:branched-subunit amino acid transport protein AzlD
MMGLLVVFCLKSVAITKAPYGIPEALAIIIVIVMHRWKSNALLSIGGGTAVYMVLLQLVFK